MLDWYKSLVWYEQILWFLALVFTLIFFIQFIYNTFYRFSNYKKNNLTSYLFSFQSISIFLSIFSWVGIACLYQGFNLTITFFVSLVSGLIMMLLVSSLYYFLRKMKENEPDFTTKKINSLGEVTQDIGRKRSASGKILIQIDGVVKELNALTDFNHDVKKGTKIEVESVTENGEFIIKPLQ